MPETIRIPLRNRDGEVVAYTLVDETNVQLAAMRWSVDSSGYGQLNRVILGLKVGDGLESDHINGDRLDNRRANLRVLTPAQNRQNTVSAAGATTRHRGVTWDGAAGRWRAQVKIDGRNHYLGAFGSEDEAGSAAAAFRLKHMPFTNEDRTGAS